MVSFTTDAQGGVLLIDLGRGTKVDEAHYQTYIEYQSQEQNNFKTNDAQFFLFLSMQYGHET